MNIGYKYFLTCIWLTLFKDNQLISDYYSIICSPFYSLLFFLSELNTFAYFPHALSKCHNDCIQNSKTTYHSRHAEILKTYLNAVTIQNKNVLLNLVEINHDVTLIRQTCKLRMKECSFIHSINELKCLTINTNVISLTTMKLACFILNIP